VKSFQPRKMKILKKKDQAECIGYLLADYKRPYAKLRVTIDAINFPMTTKLKNKRLADKPPLPPPALPKLLE
jgi:hypothetical protein